MVGLVAVLVIAGQILVIATFYRLGRTGVFFGDQLGYAVRRCEEFPFSMLAHPQYVGTLLTTIYYLAGMWLEVSRAGYFSRYASITFKMRSLAARLTEGSERSRPT